MMMLLLIRSLLSVESLAPGFKLCPVLLLALVTKQLVGQHRAKDADQNAHDGDAEKCPQAGVEDAVNGRAGVYAFEDVM